MNQSRAIGNVDRVCGHYSALFPNTRCVLQESCQNIAGLNKTPQSDSVVGDEEIRLLRSCYKRGESDAAICHIRPKKLWQNAMPEA